MVQREGRLPAVPVALPGHRQRVVRPGRNSDSHADCTPTAKPFLPDSNQHEGWCSGDWTLGMVSDKLVIPKTMAPGKYVVSWRMDCEETAQIWQK